MAPDKTPAIKEEYRQLLCDVLNERGITDRKMCNELIDLFSSIEKHMSVDDFYHVIEDNGLHLDKDLVALVLSTFSEFGFARELQLEGESFLRYEHLHP